MLKIFNSDGICQQIIAIGNFDLARIQAKEEGNTAFESSIDEHEILNDGILHKVSSPWDYDVNKEVTVTGYELVDDAYQYTYTERDITSENEAKDAEILSGAETDARAHRNRLLAETDFYALSDVTMSDAIATYRQALRDLPTNRDWPDVTFPEKPEE